MTQSDFSDFKEYLESEFPLLAENFSINEIIEFVVRRGLTPDQLKAAGTLIKQGFPEESQVGY